MCPRFDPRKQDGFSLIELMISLAITLIILATVFSLYGSSVKMSTTTFELVDAEQSVRTAQEYINRDLVIVGDGLRSINSIFLPEGFVQTWLTGNLVNPIDGYVKLPIISSDDNVPGTTAIAGVAPSVNILDGTDRITMLTVDPTFTPIAIPAGDITPSGSNVSIPPANVGQFNIGDFYFITSSVGGAFGVVTNITNGGNPNIIFANSDPYDLNQPGNGGPINVVSGGGTLATSLMRMNIISYFVNANGLLIRRLYGAGGFTDSVIAEHVVNLQFRYILGLRDVNGNLQQPVAQLATPPQQTAVRQVEVTVTTETVHVINSDPNQPAHQRITKTARTSVRNLQFREEVQP